MPGLAVLEHVTDCGGCGACCRELDSPPGYAVVAAAHAAGADPVRLARMESSADWAEDVRRWRTMPAPLRDGLDEFYRSCGPDGDLWAGNPCLWWDHGVRTCRHHDWRPSICRDFQAGSNHCGAWRRKYPPGDFHRVPATSA